jgi:hypothetical protein
VENGPKRGVKRRVEESPERPVPKKSRAEEPPKPQGGGSRELLKKQLEMLRGIGEILGDIHEEVELTRILEEQRMKEQARLMSALVQGVGRVGGMLEEVVTRSRVGGGVVGAGWAAVGSWGDSGDGETEESGAQGRSGEGAEGNGGDEEENGEAEENGVDETLRESGVNMEVV